MINVTENEFKVLPQADDVLAEEARVTDADLDEANAALEAALSQPEPRFCSRPAAN